MEDFERKTSPKNGIDTENWFIESYRRYKGHPIRILIALYKGNYHKFVMAVICFFIKHACVWVLPIITANIINDVTQKNPDTVRNIWISAALEIGLIALNIPMNYLYTSYKSLATRYAETGLRKALIRKLQQLSIAYHVETQSGRLQSKIMRDVEAVETLSTQMFLSILNIALNIGVALVVTASKSKIVFVFFLLTTPVAAITMVSFRSVMKKRNTEFRKEMEETSARVMEMVELVPVTRAHALEDEEVHKMSGQLFTVAEKGYKLDLVQALFGSVGWAVFQVFQVVCLAFTGYLALRGRIMAGDITLYQSYFATVAEKLNRRLVVMWKREVGCNIRFSELFDLPFEVVEISENGFKNEPVAQLLGNHAKKKWRKMADRFLECDDVEQVKETEGYEGLFHLIEQTPVIYLKAFGPICEVGAESYSFLKPGKNIEEKGDYLFRELTGNCVGVHVRRTDHTDAIANSPLALFAGRMKKELEADKETSFFVATDDKEVRRELKELLPDAKLIFPQSDVIDRDSKEGIEEAFVEMIALSKCRKILGSYNSTFSLLPSYIGNIPLETVCRKES